MEKIYLGIDPGIADAGYGVIASGASKDRVITHGSITTPAAAPMEQRLMMLYKQLSDLLEQHRPHAVAIEKIYFSKNVKTALQVTEARGVIRLCIAAAGLLCVEFNPADVKIAVCGTGSAEKAQVQKMVTKILGLKEIPKPDDAADALALAMTLAHTAAYATRTS